MASGNANLLQGGPMLGSGLLWLCAISLLLVTLGLIVAAKIVLAFLLAIGPIFIGMLLFDATRGLFDGWVRATISFAMAPLAVNVFGAVMLMMLAPFLEILVGNAGEAKFDMGPVITIALIITVFAIVMAFGLAAVSAIGRGFGTRVRGEEGPAQRRLPAPEPVGAHGATERAEQIAARIAMIDRSLPGMAGSAYSSRSETFTRRSGEIADAVATTPTVAGDRLGQAYSRAPKPNVRRGEEG